MFNEYGPTEATVWCTAGELTGPIAHIGLPIPGARVEVVDRHLSPTPPLVCLVRSLSAAQELLPATSGSRKQRRNASSFEMEPDVIAVETSAASDQMDR